MILGIEEEQIVKMAESCHSEIEDGVAQYNFKTGELEGASFTTGTVENPENTIIEIFRLPQGEDGEFDMKCHENGDCPFFKNGEFDEDMVDEYGDCRIDCCIIAYLENEFDEDFENNFRESVEQQVRDVLTKYLSDTIEILDDIRKELIFRTEGTGKWQEAIQDKWADNVLDSYVDSAMDDGFSTSVEPVGYLDADVEFVLNIAKFSEDKLLKEVAEYIEDYDLKGALELLQ